MDIKELEALIDIVFQKEFDDLSHNKNTWTLEQKEDKKVIQFEHADTLLDIFSNCESDPKLKAKFIKKIKEELESSPEKIIEIQTDMFSSYMDYASSSALAFYVLLRLGFVEEIFSLLEIRRINKESGAILHLMNSLLDEDYAYFDLTQIATLLKIMKMQKITYSTGKKYKSFAISKLSSNAYDLVKKNTKGINIEINRDKESVIEIIKYLDFDDKYNQLLHEIDKFIYTDSSIVTAGMIGNLRSFMEDLFTDVTKKISSINKEEIPNYQKNGKQLGWMGRVREYLKINLELSDKDNDLINKYIGILHANGGHTFVSNKDYFRLSRNIGIEIVLLILSKYKDKFSK